MKLTGSSSFLGHIRTGGFRIHLTIIFLYRWNQSVIQNKICTYNSNDISFVNEQKILFPTIGSTTRYIMTRTQILVASHHPCRTLTLPVRIPKATSSLIELLDIDAKPFLERDRFTVEQEVDVLFGFGQSFIVTLTFAFRRVDMEAGCDDVGRG